ncbi:ATP-binding protein [Aegicerativicinus sediminis]
MMKVFVVILLIFSFNFQNYPSKRSDSLNLEYEKISGSANAEKEIDILYNLFLEYLTKDENYNEAYYRGARLERLINENPDLQLVKEIRPNFYHKMGWLNSSFVQYGKAVNYLEMALASVNESTDKQLKTNIRGTLAFNYFLNKQIEEAFNLANQSLNEAEESQDDTLIANANITFYALLIDSLPSQALSYAKKSLATKDLRALSHRNINIGTCYKAMGVLDSALYYTEKGLKIALDNNFKQQQSNAHVQLKYIHYDLGEFEDAIEHDMAFDEVNKDLASYDSGMRLFSINQSLNEDRIKLQQKLLDEKFYRQRIIIYGSIIVLIIIVPILIILINRLKLIERQKREIEKERTKAQISERHKEQFLANMSHEIRTPMHAISGMSNSLLRNPKSGNLEEYLRAIKTSSDNLSVLLDDILDLSKIESGKLKIENKAFNPTKLIDEILHLFALKADEKGIKISMQIDSNVPSLIIGDYSRLNQILINLIGNSLKFTDEGSVVIEMTNEGQRLRFAVRDTGVGIPKEQQDLVFDTFEQGEMSKSQIYKGTGLGLSIAKKLIELQGGTIWLESEQGVGSTFYFEIPFKVPDTELEDIEVILADTSNAKRKEGLEILLVDDDEFNLMVIKDDLEYYFKNPNLSIAKNGEEALSLFKKNKFDLIFMDMHMPILNGCETTIKIREIEKFENLKPTPIIAMTANILESEVNKCLAAGMEEYISKPYKSEDLVVKILAALDNK